MKTAKGRKRNTQGEKKRKNNVKNRNKMKITRESQGEE